MKSFRALLLGDFLLDTYTTGKVRRISPEAPVPILEVRKVESLPGGAGNVALNLEALGGSVTCIGRIGRDKAGAELKSLLQKGSLDTTLLVEEETFVTPVKNRLIADSQQLLRVDCETITELHAELEEQILSETEKAMKTTDIIALSDYGKGFLTRRIITETLSIAKQLKIPTIVDPKGIDFTKYRGATILKPNLSEAYAAAQKTAATPLTDVARAIFLQTEIEMLLITRSEAGMSLFTREGSQTDFPVVSKEVTDVTGAGDTALAVLCLAIANKVDIAQAVELANIGAGIAIERLGCAQIALSELLARATRYT